MRVTQIMEFYPAPPRTVPTAALTLAPTSRPTRDEVRAPGSFVLSPRRARVSYTRDLQTFLRINRLCENRETAASFG